MGANIEPSPSSASTGDARPAETSAGERAHSRAHVEMLRRVARHVVATPELPLVLGSITSAFVEHFGAVTSRVYLRLTPEQCDECRAAPRGTPAPPAGPAMHLAAIAGEVRNLRGLEHVVPLHMSTPITMVARERRAFLTNRVLEELRDATSEDLRALYAENGITSACACPLIYRDELLGVAGMLSRRPIDPRAFEVMAIFADQAALAIHNARLYGELAAYRDRLAVENAYLQDELRAEQGFDEIIGRSDALRDVLRRVRQVAAVDTTVLLTGETGTGKELIARAIHGLSGRRDRAMIKLNCGAIPQGMVESELFGHERGAFTGALQRRAGRFELADRGTLFLDEVGELPPETQVKLLRVLQEQEFERVGGTQVVRVDARLITATNRDLGAEVRELRFRHDLFYRLNVFPIHVPPLRERREDIPLLVRHFVAHFRRRLGRPLDGVTADGMRALMAYHWPGNIRELQNVIERACVLATGPVVQVADALGHPESSAPRADAGEEADASAIVTLEEHERRHITRALERTGGRIHGDGGAAALLGINASTLRSRMARLGLRRPAS